MKQETIDFLHFVDQEFHLQTISIKKWKEYLRRLPDVYNGDISFRLSFDWHWDLALSNARASIKSNTINIEDPIYAKQVELIIAAGNELHAGII